MNVTAKIALHLIPEQLKSQPVFLCIDDTMISKYGTKLAVPLGYRMWQKKESKLELAASMVRQVMPEFSSQKNVIILCDSWYTKQNLVSIVEEYPNLDLIGNARADSVIYDLAPAPTGRKGRPAKHGKRLSANDDFTLSDEKINGYYIGVRRVLTNLFGSREVLAYVTTPEKDSCTRRLFFLSLIHISEPTRPY